MLYLSVALAYLGTLAFAAYLLRARIMARTVLAEIQSRLTGLVEAIQTVDRRTNEQSNLGASLAELAGRIGKLELAMGVRREGRA